MKKAILIGLYSFTLIISLVLSLNLKAQIPGIQQQPKWAMPFYFEDANGERDTVWIGYDPDARCGPGRFDTLFEKWNKIDNTMFQVFLDLTSTGNPIDSAKKIEVTNECLDLTSNQIGFINGKMPIIMKWDNRKFYSDSLPYPDIFPRPRARAEFECNNNRYPFSPCNIADAPYSVLTDYPAPPFFPNAEIFEDSVVFEGFDDFTAQEQLRISHLSIVPHNYKLNGAGIVDFSSSLFHINNNPFFKEISISNFHNRSFKYDIVDMLGSVIRSGILKEGKTIIELESPQGLYMLNVYDKYFHFYSIKLIKL